jgi:hypothetical protein
MIDWQKPIRRRINNQPARWLGTIKRRDGLNFVVALMNDEGDEEIGVFTVEGKKLNTDTWSLENV